MDKLVLDIRMLATYVCIATYMLCAHVYISKVSVNLFIMFTFVHMYAGIYVIYKDPVARREYEQRLAEEEAKKRKSLYAYGM